METNKSFWSKTQDEITVADQMKIVGVVTVMMMAPLAIAAGVEGTRSFLRNRREKKTEETKTTEES
jgi:hypothetical protein